MKIDVAPEDPVSISALDGTSACAIAHVLSSSGNELVITCSLDMAAGTAVQLKTSIYTILAETVASSNDGRIRLLVRHLFQNRDIEYIRDRWT